MRPLSLRMTGFRGYAEQEIDFAGITSVLITGPTGAGKSAIPGAMLLALTGENGSADPVGHVKNGADLCQIEFCFAHGGSTYRCLHTDSVKTGRKKTDRQFAVRDGNGGWIPKSGKSIAETNAAITQVIGQSHNELTCGPFSLQDQSGRFLDPGEMRIDGKVYSGRSARLQVTIKMLGLSRYEALRVAATTEARALEARAEILEAQVAAADASLADRLEVETALSRVTAAIQAARQIAQEAQTLIETLTGQLWTLQAEIESGRRQVASLATDQKTMADLEAARQGKEATLVRYRDILAHRAEIEAKASESEGLGTQADALRVELAGMEAEIRSLEAQKAPAEGRLRAAKEKLASIQGRIAEIQRRLATRGEQEAKVAKLKAAQAEREAQATAIQLTDEGIATARSSRDAITTSNATAQEERGRILADEKRVKAQAEGVLPLLQGAEKRAAIMGEVPCLGVEDLADRCPLLDDARRSRDSIHNLKTQHRALCAWQRPVLPEIQATEELDRGLRVLAFTRSEHQGTLALLDQEIRKFTPAEAEIAALDMLAADVPRLEEEGRTSKAEYDACWLTLQGLDVTLEECGKKQGALRAAVQPTEEAMSALSRWISLVPEIALAEREIPGIEADCARLADHTAALAIRIRDAGTAQELLAKQDRALAEARGELVAERARVSRARADEQMATDAAAQHRARLASLETLAGEREAGATEAAGLRTRHTIIVALTEFYRQAPVMILDNEAVPVLQEEANRFLARTTANRMSVRLETQREIKSRETLADGLEIYIRDWRGERSYDDYSGGQRFELALAFRVAWTKLQERRAGIGMDCLVVDEGFGSLSAGDLDAVMGALREIQSEFGFLAVISHVEALGDLFPTKIQVSGGDTDSCAVLLRG